MVKLALTLNESVEMLRKLEENIRRLESVNDVLRRKLSTFNKDVEIQKYRAETDSIRKKSLVMLTDSEIEKRKQWHKHHEETGCKCRYFKYVLSPCSIGMGIQMVCSKCGFVEEIADDF